MWDHFQIVDGVFKRISGFANFWNILCLCYCNSSKKIKSFVIDKVWNVAFFKMAHGTIATFVFCTTAALEWVTKLHFSSSTQYFESNWELLLKSHFFLQFYGLLFNNNGKVFKAFGTKTSLVVQKIE